MTKIIHENCSLMLAIALLALLSPACIAGADTPTAKELANATYSGIDEGGPVTLADGRWAGKPYEEGGASFPQVGMAEDFYLAGDLNGDGDDEAVVLLWRSTGGTGIFNYLVAADRKDGEIRNLGMAEIGDRVQVRSGRIEGGLITLDLVQHAEGEPSCCPSELATRSWSLQGSQLKEGKAQITGKLSLATLTGTEWVLTHSKQNKAMTEGVEVTLSFAEGQVSGKSACNRYSASVEQGDGPSDLKIGSAIGTRMACPDSLMEAEQQYLHALSQVIGFRFLNGKLVLNWGQDEQWSAMFFIPR